MPPKTLTKKKVTSLPTRKKPKANQLFSDAISVVGAKEHNLKNISVEIPKHKLVTITGVSGSGKSSLAFDTIYAEGQRRYVESLSSYARQFLGQMEKPKYESIRGLSPTIAIEQKSSSTNPRSTVGTITEIYDYLRVLFARVGRQICPSCGQEIGSSDSAVIVDRLMLTPTGTKALLLAPILENRKGEQRELLKELKKEGFRRIRLNGEVKDLDQTETLPKARKNTVEIVVDRIQFKRDQSFKKRLVDSVETALRKASGRLILSVPGREDQILSEQRSCCGVSYPELEPATFSFNSPAGMCESCNGLGYLYTMDVRKLIPDETLSIKEGAIKPWASADFEKDGGGWVKARLKAMEKQWQLDIDKPWKKLPQKMKNGILHGSKAAKLPALKISWKSEKHQGSWNSDYEGLINALTRRYKQTSSDAMKKWYGKYMSHRPCETCSGKRLKPWTSYVHVENLNISDVTEMKIGDAADFFRKIRLKGHDKKIAEEVLKEINSRLQFLCGVGLEYLSLDRSGPTLSGGEAQRIRLASQIGSELTGVLYVLDEPSIGLHQRDNEKLIATLKHLRDIGNSVLVVEHDEETILSSDWVIELGPAAGLLGGHVVAEGTPASIKRSKASLTGKYLKGSKKVYDSSSKPTFIREQHHYLTLHGANSHNLKNISVTLPLNSFVCVSGVSGAGKSTLIKNTLFPALRAELGIDKDTSAEGLYDSLEGAEKVKRVINIDQKPIGRTPRSNPATYTKVYDLIRDFFALLPESRVRGYKPGRFSFNVKGGRCEICKGDGQLKVEMHFLADVYVPCHQCGGDRFNEQTLEVKYKDHSIADVLNLSIREARVVFDNHPKICTILDTLLDVGLGYVKLGQSSTTLSGGEAQRIKLARELAKTGQSNTLFLLDEPTTGLHFEDISNLLRVLRKLVGMGNSVLVIEHNLEVLRASDWIIDIGPEGGAKGGKVVYSGPTEKLRGNKKSITARYI